MSQVRSSHNNSPIPFTQGDDKNSPLKTRVFIVFTLYFGRFEEGSKMSGRNNMMTGRSHSFFFLNQINYL